MIIIELKDTTTGRDGMPSQTPRGKVILSAIFEGWKESEKKLISLHFSKNEFDTLTKSFVELLNAKAAREFPRRCSQTLYLSQISRSLLILSQWPVRTEPASARTNNGVTEFDWASSARHLSSAETSIQCREPNIVFCGIGRIQWNGSESYKEKKSYQVFL